MSALVEITVQCPHCGEQFETMADTSQGSYETVEDCWVCCRPIELTVECERGEVISVDARR